MSKHNFNFISHVQCDSPIKYLIVDWIYIQTSGNADSTEKRLEVETERKIQYLNKAASQVSPDVVAMLTKYITTIKT